MDKRTQVQNQCRAVVHLAHQIANLCADDIQISMHVQEHILDMIGQRTARLMDQIGDELNGMDAVSEGDEWMDGIFEVAHTMFPVKK
jgi:hypothetical protein